MKYWTQAWSLMEGCTYVSPGCDNCWSAEGTHRRAGQKNPKMQARYGGLTDAQGRWTGEIRLMEEDLYKPFSWRKPRVVAIWNDLFHEAVPDDFLAAVYVTMSILYRHTFLVFTKRPERAAAFLGRCRPWEGWIALDGAPIQGYGGEFAPLGNASDWPFANIFYIISAENQEMLDRRLGAALNLPGPVVLNLEPLLGPVDLRPWLRVAKFKELYEEMVKQVGGETNLPEHLIWDRKERLRLAGVLCGGESGPGARPMHPDWVRRVRDDCDAAGVPFFFKQWGEYLHENQGLKIAGEINNGPGTHKGYLWPDGWSIRVGKKAAGRVLDGRTWDELPVYQPPAASGQQSGGQP